MRISFRQSVIATTAIIGLSAFAAVAAQPGAGDPTVVRHNTAANTPAPTSDQTSTGRNVTGKAEQRITDLHARLLISPAQSPQWDQFAQVMRDNAHSMDETFQNRAKTLPGMTATENMQSYAQVSMNHAKDMQKLVPAFQALYDTMSESQKRTADEVFRTDAHHGDRARRS